MTGDVRAAAVAGRFYPADPAGLRQTLLDLVPADPDAHTGSSEPAGSAGPAEPVPKAIIAPHAGYPYSGASAGAVYRSLRPSHRQIRRVVLLGPAHYVAVNGLAGSPARAFATPLGEVPVDQEALSSLADLPWVRHNVAAHTPEHCLEVQLPFLQTVLAAFSVVPLLAGAAPVEAVATVLDRLWDGPETLLVVSSDLSHFLDYARARRRDQATASRILALEPLDRDRACGWLPINGLLQVARSRELRPELVNLCNSGDTGGPRDRVVGYGAFAFYAAAAA